MKQTARHEVQKGGIAMNPTLSEKIEARRESRPRCCHRSKNGAADSNHAFTFTELLVVLGVLALLTLLAVPVLANGKAGSQRAVCASNLARIGKGFDLWSAEHGGHYPIQVHYAEGGTFGDPSSLNNNIWYQFAWVSNGL